MKNILYLFALIIFSSLSALAQAPPWSWALSEGQSGYEKAYGIALDPSGNVFVMGTFDGDSVTFGSTTFYGEGRFLIKYNSNGSIIWAERTQGILGEVFSIATDINGNVYVTGLFQGSSMSFDSITINNNSNSFGDAFIVKYDSNGNALWAKSFGGNWNDYPISICTDQNANVIVTGFFESDSVQLDGTTLYNEGNSHFGDVFVLKFDQLGNLLWAKNSGGNSPDYSFSVACDLNGNAFITGTYSSDSISFGTTTLYSGGDYNIFVVKYDTSGNILWAKAHGGGGVDEGIGVATDAAGNAIVTGTFESSGVAFGTTNLTNTSHANLFIAKYDPNGNVIWAKTTGGTSLLEISGIATDGLSNIFISGYYRYNSLIFGTTTFGNGGNDDIFIAKYDASGNPVWAKSPLGSGSDLSTDIATDASGNIYVTGIYQQSTVPFGIVTFPYAVSTNILVAKLGNSVTAIEENYLPQNVTIYPNPTATSTTINIVNPISNATLTLYNSMGQLVSQIKNITEQTVTFNRNDLPAGLYLMSLIENDQTIEISKLVITD